MLKNQRFLACLFSVGKGHTIHYVDKCAANVLRLPASRTEKKFINVKKIIEKEWDCPEEPLFLLVCS